jgi:hypothetical protein
LYYGNGLCEHRQNQSEKSGNDEECSGSCKETDEEPLIYMFGEVVLRLSEHTCAHIRSTLSVWEEMMI